MIHINFSREVRFVDDKGVFIEQPSPQDTATVFTDTSAIKETAETASPYRYYNKHDGLYYCEKTTSFAKSKSLLGVLNLRPGVLVGVQFANGMLLLLGYVNGMVKKALTSKDVNAQEEINYQINEWWEGKKVPYEVYGINLPFAKLVEMMNQAPVLKDSVQEAKKRLFVQKVASAAMVVMALVIYAVIVFAERAVAGNINTVKAAKSGVQSEIKRETMKKLPLYIDYINIPLDMVLKEMAWLEGKKYSTVSVTAQNSTLRGDVTVSDAGSAFVIKESAGRSAQVKIKGGVIDISFEKQIASDSPGVSYGGNFRDLFSRK